MMINRAKKLIIGALTIGFMLTAAASLTAEPVQKNVEAWFGQVKLVLNGQAVDKETVLIDGTTYMPLRAIGEMLDLEVIWDEASQTAIMISDDYDGEYMQKGAQLLKIELPENWVEEIPLFEYVIFQASNKEKNENIEIVYEDRQGINFLFEDYCENIMNGFYTRVTNIENIEEKEIIIDGRPARQYMTYASFAGMNFGFLYNIINYEDKFVQIILYSEISAFEDSINTYEQILNSYKMR